MDKSHFNKDPKVQYCVQHSYKLHPIQKKLIEISMQHEWNVMIGAPEVIQACTCFIKQAKGKNILDIGTFTGFSALSWALAIPDDGRVITMDVQGEDYEKYGKKLIEEAGVAHKIDFRIQPALKTLDELIASGQSGKFDFAFLDAAKEEYPQYYEKSVQLLRSGGIIAVDNAIWGGKVLQEEKASSTRAIDELNKIIANDDRVNNILLPIGDGLHLAFKK